MAECDFLTDMYLAQDSSKAKKLAQNIEKYIQMKEKIND